MAPAQHQLSPVVVRAVPELRVLGLRREIKTFPEQGQLWAALRAYADAHGISTETGAPLAVHYSLGAAAGEDGDIDVEVCMPVDDALVQLPGPVPEGFALHSLRGFDRAAVVTLQGSCVGLSLAHEALQAWLATEGVKKAGPTREVYLTMYTADPMSDDYRCEVLAPLV